MPNLLLYVEAREANALAYPEELYDDRQPDPRTKPAHDRLLDELFDARRATRPEYAAY